MNVHRPRKRFGQHFLTDPAVIDSIVDAISPQAGDVVVEIGPGLGAITEPLARRAGRLHCIELDRDLVAALRARWADSTKVSIHEADALTFDFGSLGSDLRIVGNLPYNISTPLLFHLLDSRDSVRDMHFMLQKEVVERMAAAPGSKAYGRLGIMLGCHLDIEALFDVDRESFSPPPSVTSAIVRLTPLSERQFEIEDETVLGDIVATAFSQRRKTLRNSLKSRIDEAALRELDIDPGQRAETLAIADYVALANYVARQGHKSG